MRDLERIDRLRHALRHARLNALVCAHPSNVLLLTGYWPVVGTSIGIVTAEGAVGLVVPEDEANLAATGWPDVQETFMPASLHRLPGRSDIVAHPLARALRRLGIGRGRIGYERGPLLEPSSYAATNRYLAGLAVLLLDLCPTINLVSADDVLSHLRAVLTARELIRLRLACEVAETAFRAGAVSILPGVTEREVAAAFAAPLDAYASDSSETPIRAGGFAFCMSGPNAAYAHRAYARTRGRRIQSDDLVMVHCNSFVDGFWTDITRTFHPGPAGERMHQLFDAVLAAREAALDAIAPGVRARSVDRAARDALLAHGLGDACPHAIGHGVGFAAIDHLARPRIHPTSDEILQPGMVFNVEPAVYLKGFGGLRQCEMVAVTASGMELLTPFQSKLEELAPHLAVMR